MGFGDNERHVEVPTPEGQTNISHPSSKVSNMHPAQITRHPLYIHYQAGCPGRMACRGQTFSPFDVVSGVEGVVNVAPSELAIRGSVVCSCCDLVAVTQID